MSEVTAAAPVAAKRPGKALRYVAVGFSVLAVLVTIYMFSGVRPEGWMLDVSEATSSLLVPVAFVVNIVSVMRHHRERIDIVSLGVVALMLGLMIVDAMVYTFGG